MTDLLLTPSLRIHYLASVAGRLDLLPFAGYSESGGRMDLTKVRAEVNGKVTSLASGTLTRYFRSVEAGVLALARFGSFRVGIGGKIYIILALVDGSADGSDRALTRPDPSTCLRTGRERPRSAVPKA